jgi:hypothetical protein
MSKSRNICQEKSCRSYGSYCRIPTHTIKPSKAELESTGSTNDIPRLTRAAETAFNHFIRLRDKEKGCICGCKRKVEQAGHFFPAGSYSGVRFNEQNVHGIAKVCNYYSSNSAVDPEYEAGLAIRIGIKELNQLKKKAAESRLYRWTRSELIEIAEIYNDKVAQFLVSKRA